MRSIFGNALLIVFLVLVCFCCFAEASGEINPVVTILFTFFGLGVGIIVTQFLSIFGEAIPYTVVVFLLGLLLSTATDSNGK